MVFYHPAVFHFNVRKAIRLVLGLFLSLLNLKEKDHVLVRRKEYNNSPPLFSSSQYLNIILKISDIICELLPPGFMLRVPFNCQVPYVLSL